MANLTLRQNKRSVKACFLCLLGWSGREVLEQIERGYRMPKPRHEKLETPDTLYEIMLKCWDKRPDNRPTFEYLYNFFDDYFVSTEPNYKDPLLG